MFKNKITKSQILHSYYKKKVLFSMPVRKMGRDYLLFRHMLGSLTNKFCSFVLLKQIQVKCGLWRVER